MIIATSEKLVRAVFIATVLTCQNRHLCSAEVIRDANPNTMNDESQWKYIQMPKISYFEGNPM